MLTLAARPSTPRRKKPGVTVPNNRGWRAVVLCGLEDQKLVTVRCYITAARAMKMTAIATDKGVALLEAPDPDPPATWVRFEVSISSTGRVVLMASEDIAREEGRRILLGIHGLDINGSYFDGTWRYMVDGLATVAQERLRAAGRLVESPDPIAVLLALLRSADLPERDHEAATKLLAELPEMYRALASAVINDTPSPDSKYCELCARTVDGYKAERTRLHADDCLLTNVRQVIDTHGEPR